MSLLRIRTGLDACQRSVLFRLQHGPVVRRDDGSIETPAQAGAEVLKGYIRNRPAGSLPRLIAIADRFRQRELAELLAH